MSDQPSLDIRFTNRFSEASKLRDEGYEPIECAFGQHGSVMGPFNMDHHGLESHREGVAIRACRDHYGALRHDRRFVVTGSPDADATLAIIGLAGLVPQDRLHPLFYQLVDDHDRDPIGMDLLALPHGLELMWFNQMSSCHHKAPFSKRGDVDVVGIDEAVVLAKGFGERFFNAPIGFWGEVG